MRRRVYGALAVLPIFFIGIYGSFQGTAVAKGEVAEAATQAASVWKVTSKTSVVYLAGSVHLLRESDYPLPPVYEEAYAASERLFFELDIGASMTFEAQAKIAMLGKLPAGETIGDHVSSETYELLQAYFKSRQIGGPVFEMMKPGMLAVTISSLEYMRLGALPQLGVDMFYHKKAVEDGKPVEGFETTEFQLSLFNDLSNEKQEVMLKDTLENLEDSEEISDRLIEAWKTGDVATLKELLADEIAKDKEIGKVMLFKRNRSWLPTIVDQLKGNENVMVVVGAGHLVGERSLVDLLEKRGYAVEQMRYSAGTKESVPVR